jgi:hypothetical protein
MEIFVMMKLDDYLNVSVKKGRKKRSAESAVEE